LPPLKDGSKAISRIYKRRRRRSRGDRALDKAKLSVNSL